MGKPLRKGFSRASSQTSSGCVEATGMAGKRRAGAATGMFHDNAAMGWALAGEVGRPRIRP